ncbi:MAG: phosphotransferase enzyme family protein [Mycobacterium leprae]
MQQNMQDRVTPDILAESAARFGLKPDQVRPIGGGFQNVVYEFDRGILRLTHDSHRTPAAVASELNYVCYLRENGVPVAAPVPSVRGELAEVVGEFTAAAFERAQGRRPGHVEGLGTLGRITGRMHALAKRYQAPAGFTRFVWHENSYLQHNVRAYIPESEIRVQETIARTLQQIQRLPKDHDSYGLIHGDLFPGNYLIDDNGQFTLFDFDECQYCWFINDIGVLLFYTVSHPDETSQADTARFMTEFMAGYSAENALDPFWVKQLPLFVRLRQIILYANIHYMLARAGDLGKLHPWNQAVFNHARHTLAHDLPPIDYPF